MKSLCKKKSFDWYKKVIATNGEERQKKDWPGWTFPGGHVEKNEGMETAMVRELLEETGLVLKPQLVGVAEWLNDCSGARELATLFIAETADELPEETEQPLFWVTEKELREGPLAGSLAELFPVFFGEKQFYFKNNTA